MRYNEDNCNVFNICSVDIFNEIISCSWMGTYHLESFDCGFISRTMNVAHLRFYFSWLCTLFYLCVFILLIFPIRFLIRIIIICLVDIFSEENNNRSTVKNLDGAKSNNQLNQITIISRKKKTWMVSSLMLGAIK